MKKVFSYQIARRSFTSVWLWWFISIFVICINLLAFSSTAKGDNSGIKLLTEFVDTGIAYNGVIFIIICAILFANILVTSEVDRGTLAITLSTPATRQKILLSKLLVFVPLLISISLFVGIIGSIAPLMFDADFAFEKWWTIVALWALYSFAIGGITFFIGCWFNKSRYMLTLSAIILGAFFIFSMLAQMENFEFCKYLTIQTLFDTSAVIKSENVFWQMIVLPIIAVPLYVLGIVKFLKKDLPL